MAQRSIFLGSSSEARDAGAALEAVAALEALLGTEFKLVPWWDTEWENLKSALSTLEAAIRKFDFAVFLCWPDDKSVIRKKRVYQTRDNVMFEFGLFLPILGTKRTFVVTPILTGTRNTFHFLSDVGPSLYVQRYSCEVQPKRSPVHDSVSLTSAMQEVSKHIKRYVKDTEYEERDSIVARSALTKKLQQYRSVIGDLTRQDASNTHILQAAAEYFSDLLRFKAAATKRTVVDACLDVGIYIQLVDDLLNIEQLADKQKFDAKENQIKEVWVFGEEPLEFLGSASLGSASGDARVQLPKLQETIRHNLIEGVIYKYFVSESFETARITNFFVKFNLDHSLLQNLQIIRLESKAFKTFYTAHIYAGNDQEVYMSAIMPTRNDLLIKVSSDQATRIIERLRRTMGHDCIEHDISVRNFLYR